MSASRLMFDFSRFLQVGSKVLVLLLKTPCDGLVWVV